MNQTAVPQQRALDPTLAISLRLIGLLILGALVFALALALGARGTDVAIAGVAILGSLLALAPIIVDGGRPPEARQLLLSLTGIAYLAFYYIPVVTNYFMSGGVVKRGIGALAGIGGEDILRALLGVLLGWSFLLLGYMLPIGKFAARRLPQPKREWSHLQSLSVAIGLIPLGWSVVLASQFGLIPERAGSGVLGAFAASFYFGIALLTIIRLRYKSTPALLLLMVFLPPAMAYGFFLGSKTTALAPLAMVAFTHIVLTRRVRRIWLIGGLAAFVILYPIQMFQRQIVLAGRPFSAVELLSNPVRSFRLLSRFMASAEAGQYVAEGIQATTNRVDALGIASVIMHDTPSRVPFQGGWSIGLIFVSYIPRVIWPEKPVMTIGIWVTETYGPGAHIVSHTGPSWIGELYFNFGYTGIICGMLILGIYFRLLQAYVMQPGSTIPFVMGSVVVLWAILPSPDGGLIDVVNNVTFKSIPLVLAHLVVRRFTAPPRSVTVG